MKTQQQNQPSFASWLMVGLVLFSPVIYRAGSASGSLLDLLAAPFLDPVASKILLIPSTLAIAVAAPLAMFLTDARKTIAAVTACVLIGAYIIAFMLASV